MTAAARSEDSTKPRCQLAAWFLVFAPALALLFFVTLALHARLALGHWPTPMFENYDTPAFNAHEVAVAWFAYFAILAAGPLWLLLLCFRRFRVSWKFHLKQAGVYAAGWGLMFLYGWADPGRFLEWFLD
jgi:hypothetical protein